MQLYVCMAVFGLDGLSSNAAVGGAGVEALHFIDAFACCSSFAFRFSKVPHDDFSCNTDQ